MSLSFVPVKSKKDQKLLADIAGEIWRGYWPSIIGEKQTEYMIEQFQSYKAIRKYMKRHDYEYWFLVATENGDGDEPQKSIVGFTGGRSEAGTNRFFISKIYLHPTARGHGYARRVVEFYKDLGIRAYKGTGFETIDSVETDIGQGFIMDDYVMQLDL